MYMPTSYSGARPAHPTRALASGVLVLACYVAFLVLATFFAEGGWVSHLFQDHSVFFIGFPLAGLMAHFLVATIEHVRGHIAFEALSMRFRGASAAIVLWIVVFLAIVVAIRLLWPLG